MCGVVPANPASHGTNAACCGVEDSGNASYGVEDSGNASYGVEDSGNASYGVEDSGNASCGVEDSGNASYGVEGIGNASCGVDATHPFPACNNAAVVAYLTSFFPMTILNSTDLSWL